MSIAPRSALLAALAGGLAAQPPQPAAEPPLRRPLREVQGDARALDEIVGRMLAQQGQKPNADADDATFLRRAYLGIVGRIPTAAEAEAFLRDDSRTRRAALVDRLLDSPGRASHEFNWWADLLRARTRLMRQVSGEPFMHWIKASIARNAPYDQMVRDMLTASGPAHARGNGATGYLLRDLEMPQDSMANTVRLLLGTRLECAQCHNHPYDQWTQRQFYGMAAFTGGLVYRAGMEGARNLRAAAAELAGEHGRNAQQALGQLLRPLAAGLSGGGTGLARLPENYQYDDAKPRDLVAAQTIFGAPVALAVEPPARRAARPRAPGRARAEPAGKDIGSRGAFAQWLTAPDNPRFALVIANRLWRRVMGRGVFEPIDDLKGQTVEELPELASALSRLMVDLRFDMLEFERVLFHTRTFGRVAAAEPEPGEPFCFPGPVLRRMSAEQMWDSLITLAVGDPDPRLLAPGARAEEVYARYDQLANLTAEQARDELQVQVLRFTAPERFRAMQRERRGEAARGAAAQLADKAKAAEPLYRDLARARRRGDAAEVERLAAELRQQGLPLPGDRRRGAEGLLLRASDLPSPAPPGHPLRSFGQSDREQIDNQNREANVPQVLTMLNGIADERLLRNKDAALRLAIDAASGTAQKVAAVYLCVLARMPTAAEAAAWQRLARGEQADAVIQDLAWVLINSNEFRFVR
jgi:hypothetical protein